MSSIVSVKNKLNHFIGEHYQKVFWVMLLFGLCFVAISNVLKTQLGMDYRIYEYFSSLHFQNINPYKVKDIPWTDVNMSFTDAKYLDYSAFQLSLYNIAYWIGSNFFGTTRIYAGFILYSLSLVALSLLLLVFLARQLQQKWILPSVVVLVASPYFWYVSFSRSFEDKNVFLLLPIFTLLVYRRKIIAAMTLGIFAAWIGLGLLLYPLLLIGLYQENSQRLVTLRKTITTTCAFGLTFSICMLPYFPDSLVGWKRRSLLEHASDPAWFSIWNVVGEFYFSGLNQIFLALSCLLVYLMFFFQKFSLRASVITIITLQLFTSINTPAQRIPTLLCAFVLAFDQKIFAYLYSTTALFFSFLFYLLDKRLFIFTDYPIRNATELSLLLFSPILIGLFLLLMDQKKRTQVKT